MGYISKGSYEPIKSPKLKLLICTTFGILFMVLVALSIILDPVVMLARYLSRVDYGTFVHEALSRETDSVHLSVYLFNVTNAEQFVSGEDEKLKIQEVGPFTYQENRTNEDLEIDLKAGVMRYTPRHRVTFLPEESIGNPEDMIVTMPNLAMLAMSSSVTTYGLLAKFGFNMLASQLRSNATVTMSAYDYLWGYDEPLIRTGNQFLPGWISFDKLGLLDRLYDKNATFRMEVSSREEDKFMIKKVNGIGGLKPWGYEDPETRTSCNSFNNTFEGLSYPPQLSPTRPLKIYRNVLCRFMELEYQGTTNTDIGVEGLVYRVTNRSYDSIPENQCLCSKGICYEGISDLSPCMYGLPTVLSNAHFYETDPSIYEKIEGFTPNEEEHGSKFTIEQTIGMVMTTKFSVQLNVMVRDVSFNSKVKSFSNMFVPIAYFKIEQPKLADDLVATLKMIHIYSPYSLLTAQVILIIAGLLLLSHSARILYWNWIYTKRNGIAFQMQTKNAKEVSSEPLMKS
ncbi:scavenger receptor class B member 1-like [Anticarsia gemmatalis]|uniref:scavenger receptor class B member 1-like n=1 Tax=Anticarsia gemmatalis TaxID=129554 RepID=UPI003F777896